MFSCMQKVGAQMSFFASELGKARTISTNLGWNSHYKYQPSSFRISRSELEHFKRKATLELRESFYLLLHFLGYVFIFSNVFLYNMSFILFIYSFVLYYVLLGYSFIYVRGATLDYVLRSWQDLVLLSLTGCLYLDIYIPFPIVFLANYLSRK